jgi:hypothetical protein
MNHTCLLAIALLALLPQNPAQDTGLRPEPPPRDPEERRRSLEQQLEGAWQLVGVTYRDVPQQNSTFSGFMLVLPDYLSIDLHMLMKSSRPSEHDQPFFQSGVHRWRIAGPAQLETSSLIGTSNINDWESWTFEVPNVKRVFSMTFNGNMLVLDRKGESRMTFRKLERLPYPGRVLESEQERKREAERAGEQEDPGQTGGAKRPGG